MKILVLLFTLYHLSSATGIDTIPDLKFYLKVDDYTSGNAWVDRVSNVEVHVPGSASFHEGYVHLSGNAITAPLQTNPNYMQSATYVIRLRVPTIPSNLGWVMSQFGDYGWSRALTISDYRLGNVGQTPGHFESGLGSFPTDSWQVLVGTWTQGGACQTFLQGTSGNSRSCSNGRGTDSNEKLIIGGRMETDGNHNPQSVDISDVLVFNRVLNTDEINFITSTLSQPKRCTDTDYTGFDLVGSGYYSNSAYYDSSTPYSDASACAAACLASDTCWGIVLSSSCFLYTDDPEAAGVTWAAFNSLKTYKKCSNAGSGSFDYIPTDSTQIYIVVDETEMNCPCTGTYKKQGVNNPRPYYGCYSQDGCDVRFGCVIYWRDDHWSFASGTSSCKTYSNYQDTPNVPTSGWNNAVQSISMTATGSHSFNPTSEPSFEPTVNPTSEPSFEPTVNPTENPVESTVCVADEAQNLDRCEDGFEVGPYFPCYSRRYPATQLSGHFSNGWKTSEGCAFECNQRNDCEMYSFQFRDARADKVGHCVLFSRSAMTSGNIVEWGNPGSLKCVKKESLGGYRYYRLDVSKTPIDDLYWCLEELSFYDMDGNRITTDPAYGLAETQYSSNYNAGMAFNELTGGDGPGWENYYCSEYGMSKGWLQYDFQTETEISKYAIERLNYWGDHWSPVDWKFQASSDGVSWVILDEQSGITDWTVDGEVKEFSLASRRNLKAESSLERLLKRFT